MKSIRKILLWKMGFKFLSTIKNSVRVKSARLFKNKFCILEKILSQKDYEKR